MSTPYKGSPNPTVSKFSQNSPTSQNTMSMKMDSKRDDYLKDEYNEIAKKAT